MFSGPWLPGSFTKNFAWGRGHGLRQLYEHINIGFDGTLEPVPRKLYEERVSKIPRSDKIPLNFFLFNVLTRGESLLPVDELVFQALTSPHSARFDYLALFAFNFSAVGVWKGAKPGQRYPALWARQYILDRVSKDLGWSTAFVTAEDIEKFLRNAPQFQAQTSHHKVATNLSFLYRQGGLDHFTTDRIERWWVDALFLALDRIVLDASIDGKNLSPSELPSALLASRFVELTGVPTTEKAFATGHLLKLYDAAGSLKRFEPDQVSDRIAVLIPDYRAGTPNDDRPPGALHPTNPRILKTIPRSCAPLAELVGFEIVFPDELESFDPVDFINRRVNSVPGQLKREGHLPILSAEQLHKLTRGE